jgi:hypothetical protein
MERSPRGRHRTGEQWQSIVTRAESRPLVIAAFCAAEGIRTTSFYLWRKRLQASALERMEAVSHLGASLTWGC